MKLYSDRYDWINALIGTNYHITNVNFNDEAVASGISTVTSGGITIEDNIGHLQIIKRNDFMSNGNMLDFFFNQAVNVLLPGDVYALGFDLVDGGWQTNHLNTANIVNVKFSTGETFDKIEGRRYVVAPIFSFFGFVSHKPISTLSFKPSVITEAILDNFSYAQSRHLH